MDDMDDVSLALNLVLVMLSRKGFQTAGHFDSIIIDYHLNPELVYCGPQPSMQFQNIRVGSPTMTGTIHRQNANEQDETTD